MGGCGGCRFVEGSVGYLSGLVSSAELVMLARQHRDRMLTKARPPSPELPCLPSYPFHLLPFAICLSEVSYWSQQCSTLDWPTIRPSPAASKQASMRQV